MKVQSANGGNVIKDINKIMSRVRRAVERYSMIGVADRICIGVSGGKDSLVLLCALAEMRRFADYDYDVIAVTVDNGLAYGDTADYSRITELCSSMGVRHEIIKTDIHKIVFELREEKNPCSLCASLRRGALTSAAGELGCTSVALGHHLDDVAETYLMNILLTGRAGCFSPVTDYEMSGLALIRPMIYLRESEISGFASKAELPVLKKTCPLDGETERAHFKELLREEDRRHRGVYTRILGALERSGVDSWHE